MIRTFILFLQKYTTSMDFVRKFERQCGSQASVKRLRSHPSYHSFNNKWNLPVYFQIRLVCIFLFILSKVEFSHSKMICLRVGSPHCSKFHLSKNHSRSQTKNLITNSSNCFIYLSTISQNHSQLLFNMYCVVTLNLICYL